MAFKRMHIGHPLGFAGQRGGAAYAFAERDAVAARLDSLQRLLETFAG